MEIKSFGKVVDSSKIFIVFILILIGNLLVFAQNVQHQNNTVDKSFRSSLKVDPVTLGMNLNIPLGGYAGRGGTSLPVGISYSSKLWKMQYEGFFIEGPCCITAPVWVDGGPGFPIYANGMPTGNEYSWVQINYAEDSGAGWRGNSTFPEIVSGISEHYDYNGHPRPDPVSNHTYLVDRFRLRMPDGSTHEFRVDDKPLVNPTGSLPYPRIYYSVDGSRLKYVKESETNATLYLPDGSRYVWGNGAYFIDRNGNKLTYTALNQWTDTMGRVINLPNMYNRQQPADENYTLPSIGNTTFDYTLRWRYLKNTQTGETVLSGNPTPQLHYLGDANSTGAYPDPNITPTLFQSGGGTRATPAAVFNPVVLAEVELPDGSKYKFRYNVYGEIDKIIYPTGSYEKFEYDKIESIDPLNAPYTQANRGVKKRSVSENGTGNDEITTEFSAIHANTYIVTTTNPDGTYTERVIQKGKGPDTLKYGFDDARAGSVIEERFYSSANQMVRRTLNSYIMEGARGTGAEPSATRDARLEKQISIIIEPNSANALMTQSTNEYDSHTDLEYFAYLNVKRVKEYGFVPVDKSLAANTSNGFSYFNQLFNSQTPARITETDYLYDANYKARGILGLTTETRVMNPAAPTQAIAKTQTIYDNTLPAPSSNYPYSLHNYGIGTSLDCSSDPQNPKICWQDPNSSLRGNPTTSRVWNKDEDTWIETHTQYDQFGNAVKAKDAIGNEAETQFNSQYKYAYPVKSIAPAPGDGINGTNLTSKTETTYDFNTGLPTKVKDDFGQEIETEYDEMLRPERVSPVAPLVAPITETIYGEPDANGQFSDEQRFVKVRKQIDQANWDEATTWFDGLGRTIKTQAKDSQGDVFIETKYDKMGRVQMVTNPYRAGDAIYWNLTEYDKLGRVIQTREPLVNQNPAVPSGNILGTTHYSISTASGFVGTVVTTKDASNRRGRSITNALGQLLRVDEPTKETTDDTDEAVDLGAIETPKFPTLYTYDVYGKMVKVQQGKTGEPTIQYRYFKYDSLGRLIRVRQPEQEINASLNTTGNPDNNQWTAGFAYDILGNVKRATDANGVNIITEYDKASRVTKRCYTKPNITTTATNCSQIGSGNDSTDTPSAEYWYDGKGLASEQSPYNFAKGKLTKVYSSVSETHYTQFDNFGRLKESQQKTPFGNQPVADAEPRISKYTYNFSGALSEQEYPSKRVVKHEFEADGDLSKIHGKAQPNAMSRTYASGFTYTPDGRIEKLQLGNGLWESAKFDPARGQVTELALGTSAVDGSLWKLEYKYGELAANGVDVEAAKNTGNIAKQILSFNGLAQPLVQTYRYDSLYRLKEARETAGTTQTAPQMWKQVFDYDRFGNRNFNEAETTTLSKECTENSAPSVCPSERYLVNPTINAAADNRFNSGQNYSYDRNGNIIGDIDPLTLLRRRFTFNGDNKQTKAEFVDQNGNPLRSIGEYFYDGEGKRVKKKVYDESNVVKEETVFIYDGMGKLVAEYSTAPPPQNPTTSFTATDQLGSPRVITNSLGEVTSRRDFQPFGEELLLEETYRKAANQYGVSDSVRQRFTGYQKDIETGLDFAEARMYENRHGRFTAIDPLLASGKSANPQTFNRYAYVMNNPLAYTDPSGLQAATDIDERTFSCKGEQCDGTFVAKTNTETRDNPIASVEVTWVGSIVESVQTALQSVESLFGYQYERYNSFLQTGGPRESPRLLGTQGPPTFDVVDRTLESYEFAGNVGLIGLNAQSFFVGGFTSRGSTLTTNRGFSGLTAGSIRNVNRFFTLVDNCTDCVIATDATLAGRPTSALNTGRNSMGLLEQDIIRNTQTTSAGFIPMSQREITRQVTNAGNGARGIVWGARRAGEEGHVFNVINQRGTVRFLDGQSGGRAIWESNFTRTFFMWTNRP